MKPKVRLHRSLAILSAVLLLALRAGGGPAAPAAGQPDLDALRKQFEKAFQDLQGQERETARQLRQSYLSGLRALEDALQSAGNQLSAVLAVHAERERFEQTGDIPEGALSDRLPALRKLQDAWRQQTSAAPKDQAQKIVAASERYLQNLANLQKSLAARNDAAGVAAVIAEKDRLLGNNRVREALALQQEAPPGRDAKPAQATGLPKGLILYYSFDREEGGMVTDKSGKKNDGKLVGAKWTPQGKQGGACKFDGARSYLNLKNIPSLGAGSKNFTISLWAYFAADSGLHRLFDKDPVKAGYSSCMIYQSGRLVKFYASSRGRAWDIANALSIGRIDVGQWYHIVVRRNGETFSTFLDNVPGDTTASSAPLYQGGYGFQIGRYGPSNSEYFNGSLDEIMVFDRALTDEEIGQLYNTPS